MRHNFVFFSSIFLHFFQFSSSFFSKPCYLLNRRALSWLCLSMVWLSWLRRDQTTRWNTLLPTCWKTTQRRNKPRPKTNAEKKKKKKRRTFLTNIKGINPFASVLLTTTRRRRRYHREDGKHLFNLLVGRRRMFVIVGGSGRGRRKKVTLIWFVILINIAIYAWRMRMIWKAK